MVEQFLNLEETTEDGGIFLDLTSGSDPRPVPEAELTATIATMAAKRVADLPDAETKQKYDQYYDLALMRQDDLIRGELVALKFDKLQSLSNELALEALGDGDGELVRGLNDLTVGFDPTTEKLTIIEEQAAKQIVEEGLEDEDRAAIALENMEFDVSYEDVVEEALTESLMITGLSRKYLDRLGWNADTIGAALMILMPLSDMNIMSQKIKTAQNDFLTGNDLQEQIASFRAMSIQEKAKTLQELDNFFDTSDRAPAAGEIVEGAGNNLAALTYFLYLQEFTTEGGLGIFNDRALENGIHILDMTLVGGLTLKPMLRTLGLGFKIGQALLSGKVATSAVLSGNRSSAVKQVRTIIDQVASGEVAKDSVNAKNAGALITEGQLNPVSDIIQGSPSIAGRLEIALMQIERLTQEIIDTQQVRYLDPTELEEATSVYRQRLAFEQIEQGVHHADILRFHEDTIEQGLMGTRYVAMYGDAEGKGFASAEAAMGYADYLKLEGAVVTSKEINGTHYLALKKPIELAGGFIKPYEGIDAGGGLRRLLASPSNYVGAIEARTGHLTLGTRESVLANSRELTKLVKRLKGDDKAALGEVLEFGRSKEMWFSVNDLRHRFKMNDNQIVAYHAIRRMDDVNHIIINSAEFNRKERLGFKTINLKNAEAIKKGLEKTFDARPLESISNPGNKAIYDVTEGKHTVGMTDQALKELQAKKGYVLLELEGARETEVLQPLQYIIGKAKDLKVKSLSYNQVEYKAGGRVDYVDNWFVKQPQIRYRGANTVPILMKSKTYGVGTKADAQDYVRRMNAGLEVLARHVGQDGKLAATVDGDRAMAEATGGVHTSLASFEVRVGIKNVGSKFEFVQDGQELEGVRRAVGAGANAHPYDLSEVNSIQRMISRRGSHKSQRGVGLRDFDGRVAPVINPVEAATKSLERALNVMSHDVWRQRNAEKFFRTFQSVLEGGTAKSPMGHFIDPVWVDMGGKVNKTEAALIEQGRKIQQHYKAVMNTPTAGERFIKNNLISPLVDIFNSASKKVGFPGLADETVDNLKDFDPIGFIRSLSYNANLGMFNLKQPAIQVQATMLMMAANPVNGVRAAALAAPMRLMLASENGATLSAIAKAAGRVVGLNGAEVREMYDILQRTGTWRMKGGGLVEQEARGLSSASVFQKFLDAGQVPFLESERYNKISATLSAAMDWRKANPKAAVTEEAIDIIRTRGEFYVANMNRVDRAAWQQGVLAMPTQFWGYQARAMEMMLPVMAGGSKNFTTGQKLRMTIAQLGLYGVGGATSPRYGLRFRDTFGEMYEEQFGEKAPEGFLDTIEKGMIESILSNALDIDIAFAHRAGLGLTEGGWGEVATKIATMDTKEILKIDAAGMSTLGKVLPGLYDLVTLLNPANEYFGTREHMDVALMSAQKTLRDTISSYSAYERAYLATKMGMHYDKLGRVTDRNSTIMETILGVFGLDPSNERDIRAMKDPRDPSLQRHVDLIARELNLALQGEDFTKYISLRKFLMSTMDEGQRAKVNKGVLAKIKGGSERVVLEYYKNHGILHDIED